jgi:hypothetical protein
MKAIFLALLLAALLAYTDITYADEMPPLYVELFLASIHKGT